MSAMHPKATDTSLRTACREGPITDLRSLEIRYNASTRPNSPDTIPGTLNLLHVQIILTPESAQWLRLAESASP